MELQASYIIRQLKQLLKHRKYKYVVNRIERLLEKEEDLQYFCIQFHISIRYLQLSAINKLFQRNLIKKYKYSVGIIEFLVQLSLRNLNYCHQALKEKIKERTIFTRFSSFNGTDNTFTINSNSHSIDNYCTEAPRNYSIRINTGLESQETLKKYLLKFIETCNKSVILMMQSFMFYKLDIQEGVLTQYIKNQNDLKLKNVSGSISLINIHLFYAKILFLSQQKTDNIKCEEVIEEVIERLIDVMHQINIISSRISKNKQQVQKTAKYEKSLEQCQKLIVIALVLSNKTKMKLGKETVALSGIQLFQSYLQGLSSQHKNFRRLMLPELYLQEQFLRYRTEKSQLIEIITPFFSQKVKQIEQANKQKEYSKHRLMDFYNKKNVKMAEKSSILKPKTLLSDLNTVKSIIGTTKHKNNVSIQSKLTKQRSSNDCKNKIITNMIISDIDELNSNYLKFKRLNKPNNNKKESMKSYFYKNNSQSIMLKKQMIISKTARSQINKGENSHYQTQRQKQLFLKQNQYKNYVNRQKERLIRKKKQIKLQITQNQIQTQEQISQIKQELVSNHLRVNCKYTEQKSIDIDERDVKKNMVAITSRKKTELFLEILFQSKQILGIRKIAQKFQSLRKKQQQKAKSMNNRLTSSINREQTRGSFVKFEVIAKQIIRKHISFSYDRANQQKNQGDQLETKRKQIQANYILGQRSIEAVKEKLQSKINKNDYSVDKYLKNEEIFKLKLKKLGTTNFILKKSNEDKEIIDGQ